MRNRSFSSALLLWKTLAVAMLSMIGLCGPLAARGAPETQSDASSPTLARVFAAWKARQERIKSFYFVWNLRIALPGGYQFLPEGYQFPFARGLAGVRRGNVPIEADNDIEFTVRQSEWSGEGLDRVRSDFSEFAYSSSEGWKDTGRFRITQVGSLKSRLQVPVRSGEAPTIAIWRKVAIKHPSNRIGSSGDFLLQHLETDLAPLRLAVRPLSPASGWSPENCRVVSDDALVDNAHCIKLQMDNVDRSEQCWVDPKRDYSVVRWEQRQRGSAPLNITIDPQQGRDSEWLPARWSWRLPGQDRGRPASLEATVIRGAVNLKLPETTFAADYPRGTLVYDASVELPLVESDDQSPMLPPEEARATLNAIADAWLQRQAKVKRFRYTWRTEGARNTINKLCVDGEKFMKEFKTPGWEPSSPPDQRGRDGFKAGGKGMGWPVHQSKTVFDGVERRGLSFTNDPETPGGILNITLGSNLSGGMPDDRYLMLAFYPFDPRFEGMKVAELRDPTKFRVRKQKGHIGNVACVVIEPEQEPGWQLSYWLDPARDYIPLREHRTRNGEDSARLDFSYRADPACGWALAGWSRAIVGIGGMVLNPITETVTEFTINQPIPASDFQIEAPANVKVQDWRNNRRSTHEKAADAALEAKQRAILAARVAKERAHPKWKPVYDPFADAAADVEAAFKRLREANKRMLIVFGANWCCDCCDLGVLLKENAEVATALKKDFVLVLVDTDSESGRRIQETYVPKRRRNNIPNLAVLDPTGKVLRNDDTKALEVDDDYSVPKLKAFLAEWAPSR